MKTIQLRSVTTGKWFVRFYGFVGTSRLEASTLSEREARRILELHLLEIEKKGGPDPLVGAHIEATPGTDHAPETAQVWAGPELLWVKTGEGAIAHAQEIAVHWNRNADGRRLQILAQAVEDARTPDERRLAIQALKDAC